MGFFIRLEARQAGKTAKMLEQLKLEWIAGFLFAVERHNPSLATMDALQWAKDNNHLPHGRLELIADIATCHNIDLGKLYALSHPQLSLNPTET